MEIAEKELYMVNHLNSLAADLVRKKELSLFSRYTMTMLRDFNQADFYTVVPYMKGLLMLQSRRPTIYEAMRYMLALEHRRALHLAIQHLANCLRRFYFSMKEFERLLRWDGLKELNVMCMMLVWMAEIDERYHHKGLVHEKIEVFAILENVLQATRQEMKHYFEIGFVDVNDNVVKYEDVIDFPKIEIPFPKRRNGLIAIDRFGRVLYSGGKIYDFSNRMEAQVLSACKSLSQEEADLGGMLRSFKNSQWYMEMHVTDVTDFIRSRQADIQEKNRMSEKRLKRMFAEARRIDYEGGERIKELQTRVIELRRTIQESTAGISIV